MIEINLLPAELRPTQPTPVPKLLALLGAGLFLLAEGLLLVYFHFNLNPAAQDRLKEIQAELKAKLDQAAKADALHAEIDDFKLRAKTIIQIRQARTLWAKKLDQIIDIVPDYVWLSAITVTEGQGGKKPTGATITLSCLSMSSDEKRISSFLRGIKSHPVGKEIASISDPSYTLTEITTPTKEKLDALKFNLVIELKPRTPSGPVKGAG
jgi:Tfp pilus assembly protein PilN